MIKSFIFGLALVFLSYNPSPLIAVAPDMKLADKPVEQIVEHYFGDDSKLMTAVFMAESSLNPVAVNWNCTYVNDKGKTYSTSCKKPDRIRAWSVDCGVAQINFVGKECPRILFDPVENLRIAKVEKYDKQGLKAWSVYNNGSYVKYLD